MMKINKIFAIAQVVFLGVVIVPAIVYSEEGTQESGADFEYEFQVEPKADQLLKQMSDYLESVDKIAFRASAIFDHQMVNGQKIKQFAEVKATVSKPDRFQADVRGSLHNKKVYYDGKRVSILEPDLNMYAVVEVPQTIEGALNVMADEYNFSAPLGDFFLGSPYEALMEKTVAGFYVGQDTVAKMDCHHLAFRQDHLDWEIWIAADEKKPLPRKVVIHYTGVPGSPQYDAVVTQWNVRPRIKNKMFEFAAPKNAMKIELMPLKGLKKTPEAISAGGVQ